MQQIQLYISGTKVDLFQDESVSLTNTIQNIKDISKVFTSFSQSFVVPASKVNNQLFRHYYNYNVDDGFDGRLKVSATIELNYLTFQKGKIKLEGTQLKKNEIYGYKITFYGNTVEHLNSFRFFQSYEGPTTQIKWIFLIADSRTYLYIWEGVTRK